MTKKDVILCVMLIIAGFGVWNFGYATGMNRATNTLTEEYVDKLTQNTEELNSSCLKDFSALSKYYSKALNNLMETKCPEIYKKLTSEFEDRRNDVVK